MSPKEVFAAHENDRLVIANIASPGSVRNVLSNDAVCVSFVDVFVQKGFKVRGRANCVARSDSRYASLAGPLEEMVTGKFEIHNLIEVRATAVEPILAPSYQLYPETTEDDQIQIALSAYGVSRA
ncbi:pyridoxamine 5'-phosphate oxidase family protein [Vreelandella janggokensis]|uniref:pyridoxamine 5'-phosphate oxidase family protein n=1 Tax=Vreelandella janggokensis TaxID=370767 RepID=UPI0028601D39|nr:pyridoxamine 5'-phosphate oxidase family protein [Halomonas janggokensis]MDR5886614.1 pyridoxamine 5'-phosphate oxidase family protein [Halomonas janggokensis]